MADIQYLINGVDAATWRIQRASMWRPPVTARGVKIEVPGRHGNLAGRLPVFDEPQICLEFLLRAAGGSQADLEAKCNALVTHLAQPGLVLTRVSGEGAKAITASAPARLVTVSHSDFLVGTMARVTAMLALPGVFLRGPVAVSAASSTFGTTAQEIVALAGSTGPVTDAVIRVKGPVSTVQVVDAVTGTGISWSGAALTASQYLYLDAGSLRSWVAATDSAWTPGAQTGTVDYPSAGPLQLWPGIDQKIKTKVTATATSASSAWIVHAGKSYL